MQEESPSESRLNALGVYILLELLFVFGTIVEFAIVLVVRQKIDWSKKEEPSYKELNKFEITGSITSIILIRLSSMFSSCHQQAAQNN